MYMYYYYPHTYNQRTCKMACSTEGEYAKVKERPIIPLMMERYYKPDGWLGFVIGDKLYIDFSKFEFDDAYKSLMKEIEPYL